MEHLAAFLMLGLALGIIISETLRTSRPRWSLLLLLPPSVLLMGPLGITSGQSNQISAIASSAFTLAYLGASLLLIYWVRPAAKVTQIYSLLFASYMCGILALATYQHLAVSTALSAISLILPLGIIPAGLPNQRAIRIFAALLLGGFWLEFHTVATLSTFDLSGLVYLIDFLLLAAQLVLLSALLPFLQDINPYNQLQPNSALSFKSWVAINRILRTYQHDLRQPLSTINIVTGVGKAVSEKEETRQRFQHISAAHQSFTKMLNDFFEEVRSELLKGLLPETNTTVNANWCSLGQIFKALQDEYNYFAEAKGLSLRVKQTDVELFTDRMALEKVLRNGLDNAIKYTTEGGIVMQVRRKWATKTSGYVLIQIQDTGSGIENDMTPASHKGWGYGSSIVNSLSRKIKGVVEVRNRPGKARGTCFSLTVPIELPTHQPQKLAESLFIWITTASSSNGLWERAQPAWFRERKLKLSSPESLMECIKTSPPRLGFIVCASSSHEIEEANLVAERHNRLTGNSLCMTVALAPGLEQEIDPEDFPNLLFAETRLSEDRYVIFNLESLVKDVENSQIEAATT